MNICIFSLKLNPSHLTQVSGIVQALKNGDNISLVLSEGFLRYKTIKDAQYIHKLGRSDNLLQVGIATIKSLFEVRSIKKVYSEIKNSDVFLFQCIHPVNIHIMWKYRQQKNKKFICWVHEIGELSFEHYSVKQIINLLLNRFLIALTRRFCDYLILSSNTAEAEYIKIYPQDVDRILRVPLIFLDRQMVSDVKRKYFTFVGVASKNKGVDIFFDIIKESFYQNKNFFYQIITRSNITELINSLPVDSHKFLKIINKETICDEEIDTAIRESIAVLCPARKMIQSAVVPVAYMHSTPVIGSRVMGLQEQIIDGLSGVLIDEYTSPKHWVEKIDKYIDTFEHLSENARNEFNEKYSVNAARGILQKTICQKDCVPPLV